MTQATTERILDPALAAAVTMGDVHEAARRLAGIVHTTPILTSRGVNERTGCEQVHFKCENFQRGGAFKCRGAYNAISQLSDDQKSRGVVTWSSGNHAQATALVCRLLGIKATIVMPNDAPAVKLDATRAYLQGTDGEIVIYDRASESRERIGSELAERHGLAVISPHDQPAIIAGQGTVALELFEEVGELDALFVPLGGGGLLSGCATVARSLYPSCEVIGVEPEIADDGARSFRERRFCTVDNPQTIADGARTLSLGQYCLPIILERVDDVITVSEHEIASTMFSLWERLKTVVEPTGALGAAGLLKIADQWQGKRAGVVISGGNIDPARVGELLEIAHS